MKSEIEFRGKTAKGEWVYGCLLNNRHDRIGFYNNAYNFEIIEVIPETVGQYTGIKDKNGKKVYIGDIIKANHNYYPYTVFVRECKVCIEDKYGNAIRPTTEALKHFDSEVIGTILTRRAIMDKQEFEKQLMKYSKEEIVQGIVANSFGTDFHYILHRSWQARHKRLFEEMEKASKEEQEALSNLVEIEKEMAIKYGDGQTFSLAKLSKQEFNKWCKLKESWQNKSNATEKANKSLDKFYSDCKIKDEEWESDNGD